jgi:Ni,Fe-hydrogenase III large subunit/Ni,Fe-hydrogenase III component G
MALEGLNLAMSRLPSALPLWRSQADAGRLQELAHTIAERHGRLAALWGADDRDRGTGFALHTVFMVEGALLWIETRVAGEPPTFPDLAAIFAPAGRMQRAVRDLLGLTPDAGDARPWVRHAAWPQDAYPLRRDVPFERHWPAGVDNYPFVRVAGEGVHEIPVGPVHAGIIEPGHFRFSVVGEKVLRLEERLGYTHKGIEKRFESFDALAGARLASRISGDTTVAYAWAYAMALESIAGSEPPVRAVWLRALALERERIANHLGDLGYLGNDGGLAFGLAQFMRLKEEVLRDNARVFKHRYAMDFVVPGGVACNLDRTALDLLGEQCDALETEVAVLRDIYEDHAGLQDRFLTCGRLGPALAAQLGVIGLAGRASAQAWDVRVAPSHPPYDQLGVTIALAREGDVSARVAVRFAELAESLRLVRVIAAHAPAGAVSIALDAAATGSGIGWVEGWRGEVLVALETDRGRIRRCHAHDPSWQNWPAIEHAVMGNIVPDFPLINKSFNLSYAGVDL